jgi:LPXTG-site transpeptidase (sortase) family protein
MLKVRNNLNIIIKATVKNIIVAFLYVLLILIVIQILFSNIISQTLSTIDIISINTNKKILKNVQIDLTTNMLTSYPDQPLYYGDTLEILTKGVGQTPGSYFPGEGGSIIYMGHNTSNMLRNLPNIKNNDKIIVETTYGTYTYSVYETKIIEETDLDSVPVQREKEILMLYTCYPVTAITHTTQRFIVYASRVEE